MHDSWNESKLGRGVYFDESGELAQTKCYIVYGAPASGKTTYVKEHKQSGDLVVDLDYIKQAISLEGKLEAPDSLLTTALCIRDYIYSLIEERKVDCKNVWVVAGLPRKKERFELQKRLRAKLIYIDASHEECILRSERDSERKDKQKAKEVIEKWFEKYER